MPSITTLPTAQSGFKKLQALLPPNMRADITWERGSESVTFEIRQRFFLCLLYPPIADGFMWDTWAKIKMRDNSQLDFIRDLAAKFERDDNRRVEIELWKE